MSPLGKNIQYSEMPAMLKIFPGIEVAAQSQDFKGFLYWVPDTCKAKVKPEKLFNKRSH
jgi:hypothetical protein